MQQLTKIVLESSLAGEMDAHLGYAKHDPAGRDSGNSRNGNRAKTVLTEAGPVEVYGASVSKDTISTITDRVLEGMAEWQNRPLDPVYPVILIDCIWTRPTHPLCGVRFGSRQHDQSAG